KPAVKRSRSSAARERADISVSPEVGECKRSDGTAIIPKLTASEVNRFGVTHSRGGTEAPTRIGGGARPEVSRTAGCGASPECATGQGAAPSPGLGRQSP